jgi:myo-inositol-1-phosphate synthase
MRDLTLACFRGITWRTKKGIQTPNYWGSITQASTLRLGEDQKGEEIFVPLKNVLPMVSSLL